MNGYLRGAAASIVAMPVVAGGVMLMRFDGIVKLAQNQQCAVSPRNLVFASAPA